MTIEAAPAPVERGLTASATGIAANIALAFIKVLTGIFGNSYALIADGIESTADVVSSLIVWGSLKVAVKPADENHPYGHGRAESLAGLVVAAALLVAAVLIAAESVKEIRTPHSAPAWFTLPVLLLVIATKWVLSRYVLGTAREIESSALKGDAWHHLSDAITSAAAFIGISIGLIGGKGYEAADDWAALLACLIIAYNGLLLLWRTAQELMDVAPPDAMKERVFAVVRAVAGVVGVEKVWLRKYGLGYVADLHVIVKGDLTVREGHRIAHEVKSALQKSDLRIADALIHVEPN
jgi:cation diffusion facilitator family transporter